MRKIVYLIALFCTSFFYAQTSGITYQAVIYYPNGQNIPGVDIQKSPMANKSVCLQFSLTDDLSQLEYQEVIQTTTDEFGMVNLIIGSGNQTGGYASSFNAIVWNANIKKLKVQLDVNGTCQQFVVLSDNPLSAVPFAYAAVTANNVSGVVSIQNGGTGASNLAGAKINLQIDNVDNTSDSNKPISIATQAALDTKENSANKSITTSLGTSDVLFPTQNAVKSYVDTNISTLNTSNTALQATVTANATAASTAIAAVQADVDANETAANIALALKENSSNKSTTTALGTSDVLFPTQNAVKSYVDTNITTINASNTALQATVTANATAATTAIAAVQADVNANEIASNTALALKENTANKSATTTLGTSDVLFPTQNAVKTYVDAQVASATIADADAITKGKIKLAGDLGGTADLPTVPGLTNKENTANKSAITTLGASDVLFPTQNAVKTYVDTNITTVNTSNTALQNTVTANATAATTAIAAVQADVDANEIATNNALALKEDAANKSSNIATDANSTTKYPSVKLIKDYVDTLNAAAGVADNTITSAKITDGTIMNIDVNANAAIDYSKLNLNNSIVTLDITDNAVETAKIKNDAVTTGKISNANVTYAKIQNVSDTDKVLGRVSAGSGVIEEIATTGSGDVVRATSPTLVTPVLGVATATSVNGTTIPTSKTLVVTTDKLNVMATTTSTELAGVISDETGTGALVLANSPTFTGAPTLPSGTIGVTQTTGNSSTALATTAFVASANATNADLTGPITSVGNTTSIASQTGTGTTFVMDTSPTLVTPVLGVATATSVNGTTIPTSKTLVVTTDKLNVMAATTSAELAGVISDETGTGALVLANSPTLVTPVIGAATGTSLSVSGQLTSTVATGTAPIVVTSTTPVANLSIGGNAATATKATNIAGGVSGSIPYQTAAATTAMLPKGNDGEVLTLASGLPSWGAPTGVTTMAAIGSTPNANGATISGVNLNLQPADASFGGVVTTGTQAFAGDKTFNNDISVNENKFGRGAGSTGSRNIAIGINPLNSNTTGTWNTAIGAYALQFNTTASYNTAIGNEAISNAIPGNNNTGIGNRALMNTIGRSNTAVGNNALLNSTTGNENTAIGNDALKSNTTGSNNIGIGVVAGANTTEGEYNIAIGKQALQQNITGSTNIAVGAGAIDFITTGNYNTVLGGFAGRYAGSGTINTTTLNNSMLLGYDTRPKLNNDSNEIVIGNSTVGNGSNTTTIGNANTTDTYIYGNLNVTGQIKLNNAVLSKSDTYSFLTTDNANLLVYTGTSAGKTITLPAASVNTGREITIKNIGTVSLTIASAGGTLISDSTTTAATSVAIGIEPSNNWIKAISDGTNWIILRGLF